MLSLSPLLLQATSANFTVTFRVDMLRPSVIPESGLQALRIISSLSLPVPFPRA